MLIIDRIHGDIAVLEQQDRTILTLPLTQLPPGVREGDCLMLLETGGYRIDAEETARRRAKNQNLFQKLMKKNQAPKRQDPQDGTPVL